MFLELFGKIMSLLKQKAFLAFLWKTGGLKEMLSDCDIEAWREGFSPTLQWLFEPTIRAITMQPNSPEVLVRLH